MKLIITGPPASGKTYYAEKIQKYYNIPRVHVKELTDDAFQQANAEEEEGVELSELTQEIKTKVEELRDAELARIEEEREAAGIDPPEDEAEVDRTTLPIRIPDDLIYKLLQNRLNENDCRNRGYILDGFPRSYKDAQNIFLKRIPQFDEEGNQIDVEEEELEEGEEKNFDGYAVDESISPLSCIVLKQKDEFLINRVKNLP